MGDYVMEKAVARLEEIVEKARTRGVEAIVMHPPGDVPYAIATGGSTQVCVSPLGGIDLWKPQRDYEYRPGDPFINDSEPVAFGVDEEAAIEVLVKEGKS